MRDQAEPFLLEQIKKLEEENRALREDAERYRWLRECQSIPADILHNHHEALDSAIDAARGKK